MHVNSVQWSHTQVRKRRPKQLLLKATKTSKDNCCQAVKYCVFKYSSSRLQALYFKNFTFCNWINWQLFCFFTTVFKALQDLSHDSFKWSSIIIWPLITGSGLSVDLKWEQLNQRVIYPHQSLIFDGFVEGFVTPQIDFGINQILRLGWLFIKHA